MTAGQAPVPLVTQPFVLQNPTLPQALTSGPTQGGHQREAGVKGTAH